jgi:hypothetical protein
MWGYCVQKYSIIKARLFEFRSKWGLVLWQTEICLLSFLGDIWMSVAGPSANCLVHLLHPSIVSLFVVQRAYVVETAWARSICPKLLKIKQMLMLKRLISVVCVQAVVHEVTSRHTKLEHCHLSFQIHHLEAMGSCRRRPYQLLCLISAAYKHV